MSGASLLFSSHDILSLCQTIYIGILYININLQPDRPGGEGRPRGAVAAHPQCDGCGPLAEDSRSTGRQWPRTLHVLKIELWVITDHGE